jgi:hypothetical protein
MKDYRRTGILLAALVITAGAFAAGLLATRGRNRPPEQVTRDRLVGTWSTSTLPELASSASTFNFLDSGEFQFRGPMRIPGQIATGEIDGKKQVVQFVGSGPWELDGSVIRFRFTDSNIPNFQAESRPNRIIELTDRRLVLDDGQDVRAYFRTD